MDTNASNTCTIDGVGSGLRRAVGFMLGLALFAGVFVLGLVVGFGLLAAAQSMEQKLDANVYRKGNSNTVAILPIRGIIDGVQSDFVHRAVNEIIDDSAIKSVVLRIESPGGGVTASDQIWHEIERLKATSLPVIASYGNLAASGGYYVSCGADHIVAEETTITGSIGVIAQVLTLEQLMDKIGVEPVTLVASGSPDKDAANDIFRTWTQRDRTKIQVILDAAYDTFNRRVSAGRGHVIEDPVALDTLADGSIYTARQALDNGLIDEIGYLDDAVAIAERRADLSYGEATVIEFGIPRDFLGNPMLGWRPGQAVSLDAQALRRLVNDLRTPRAMYLMH